MSICSWQTEVPHFRTLVIVDSMKWIWSGSDPKTFRFSIPLLIFNTPQKPPWFRREFPHFIETIGTMQLNPHMMDVALSRRNTTVAPLRAPLWVMNLERLELRSLTLTKKSMHWRLTKCWRLQMHMEPQMRRHQKCEKRQRGTLSQKKKGFNSHRSETYVRKLCEKVMWEVMWGYVGLCGSHRLPLASTSYQMRFWYSLPYVDTCWTTKPLRQILVFTIGYGDLLYLTMNITQCTT